MNDVPLRDYIERVMDEQYKAHEASLRATERTLDATAKALETRLHAMNEFRAMYDDRIRKLEERLANQDGRMWMFGTGVVFLATVISLAFRFLGR